MISFCLACFLSAPAALALACVVNGIFGHGREKNAAPKSTKTFVMWIGMVSVVFQGMFHACVEGYMAVAAFFLVLLVIVRLWPVAKPD